MDYFGNETTTSTTTTTTPSTTTLYTTTTMFPSTTNASTIVPADPVDEHFCKWILYVEFFSSRYVSLCHFVHDLNPPSYTFIRVRTWDWIIMLPNVFFMIFLITHFKKTKAKLSSNSSPIVVTFYVLIVVCVFTSVLRCIVSMSVNASTLAGERTDKILWVAVRFFLLSMEISVLVFGLAFGHLDSRTSIRRVLMVTGLLSFGYSLIQGTLEIIAPDERFYVPLSSGSTKLYGHGGMKFWAVTCIIFSLLYAAVVVMPMTSIRRRIPLPTKKSFYVYCGILSLMNLMQGIGSITYASDYVSGLCIIDLTTYMYFSFFHIFVYWTFLSTFFSLNASSLLFNYKHQLDDIVIEEPIEDTNSESTINALNGFEFSGETSVLSLKTATDDADAATLVDVTMTDDGNNTTMSQYLSADDFDEDTLVSDSGSFVTARGDASSKSLSISERT